MIAHVEKVLENPGEFHPAYEKTAGHELAGFVWFQGFNDYVSGEAYPNRNDPEGYAAYSDAFVHFIHDVRKDLSAPEMPFVIGVMGVDGISNGETEAARQPRYQGMIPAFRNAMAKPASLLEFKGSVMAVETAPFWDTEIDRIEKIRQEAVGKAKKEAKEKGLDGKDAAAIEKLAVEAALNPSEIKYLERNRSNQGYHYYGSAKTLGGIGKAFADALGEWYENN